MSTEVTLGDVAQWGSGGTPKRSIPEYFGDGTPWLSIADLNDGIVTSAKESLTADGIANSAAKIVPPGTLLVAMYGSIGKLGIAATEMATSQAIAFAKPREDLVDRRYLFHYLLAQRPRLQALGRGGTQMNIGQADLKAWPIPLPSLPEQRRIATILDHADTLRTKRRQVLTHLDSLADATFLETFGPPQLWPTHWSMGTIGELATNVDYGTSGKAGDTGEWPILRMGNVTDDGHLDLSDLKYIDLTPAEIPKYTVRRGDMVFNRTNSKEKVGKAAVIRTDEPLALAGYLVRVRFDDSASAEFVSAYLRSPHGKAVRKKLAKTAVNQANINATEMQRIAIAQFPASVRKSFQSILESIHYQRIETEHVLEADNDLFISLQSRAFRGAL
ncbi:MAG: restriction endonuclease subunit S [Gordonia sp.]|uniref:restriction endonuclease subunit S n=1 Tax=Gordonia sp. (in: high G+C Gram-positive bacteria) TaxID=84139 RepID=UPI001D8C84DE|nr:restriction endonuclease subunit S [Gordonia sp. (in: high G+C Gram-positive bacteria)]MCB1294861.1 restriction endonuclease subunit S [Gordonia sp. (in: high G+C Gram-positive bacteria)]HQV16728.1 restriction endonuclease subunit S [Gordonia sp. (in: high G+C Gram-positive bacteria)]